MAEEKADTRWSLRGLDWINFFTADVPTRTGPFSAIYFAAARHWDPGTIGFVVGAQSVATLLMQTPAGALIDTSRHKKWIVALAALLLALGCIGIVTAASVPWAAVAQLVVGIASSFVPACIAALALGVVGRAALPRRIGRNEAFSHGGNLAFALLAGLVGTWLGLDWIFYAGTLCALAAATVALLLIRSRDIDDEAARESDPIDAGDHAQTHAEPQAGMELDDPKFIPWRIGRALTDRLVIVLAGSIFLFHAANAAMLPLVGELLTHGREQASALYMAGCIGIARIVMLPVALLTGQFADRIGRKPIFLIGFAAIAVRGVLLSLGKGPLYLIVVQALDGIGIGIFGVVATLMIADVARGTGRFNFLQGAIAACWSLGVFASNALFGTVAQHFGFHVSFVGLAAVAILGFAFFLLLMPETRDLRRSSGSDFVGAMEIGSDQASLTPVKGTDAKKKNPASPAEQDRPTVPKAAVI
jgi:MFS family permease